MRSIHHWSTHSEAIMSYTFTCTRARISVSLTINSHNIKLVGTRKITLLQWDVDININAFYNKSSLNQIVHIYTEDKFMNCSESEELLTWFGLVGLWSCHSCDPFAVCQHPRLCSLPFHLPYLLLLCPAWIMKKKKITIHVTFEIRRKFSK